MLTDSGLFRFVNRNNLRKGMKPLIEKGGVFEVLKDKNIFRETLTVIGYTAAWDLEGNRDESKCIDIDPFELFNSPVVPDIPETC
ncbi:MAG: DUF2442 domain-containing protein [Lachnospiraceae bacterium]|nr:DUF2442 domain-containing protein [Lachnospiraceae bacterium]